jgi:hypothetical protein
MGYLQGLKTLLLMPVLGVFAMKFQQFTGVALTPEQQLAIAAGVPTLGAIGLRLITRSPILSGVRSWLAMPKTVTLTEDAQMFIAHAVALKASPTIVMGVEKVLARRIAEAQAKQNPASPEGVKPSV